MSCENMLAKAVLYLRCATSMGQGVPVADQLESLTREAARQGLEIAAVYTDVNCSGSSLKTCPQLRQLLKDAKAGDFRHLLVRDLSRLSRSISELVAIMTDLQRCGVVLHSVGEEVLM